jgi:hypothetical protein
LNGETAYTTHLCSFCSTCFPFVQHVFLLFKMFPFVQHVFLLFNMFSFCSICFLLFNMFSFVQHVFLLFNMFSFCSTCFPFIQHVFILFNMFSFCSTCFPFVLFAKLFFTCAISGSRGAVHKIFAFLGYYVAWFGRKLPTFRDKVSVPYSRMKQPLDP